MNEQLNKPFAANRESSYIVDKAMNRTTIDFSNLSSFKKTNTFSISNNNKLENRMKIYLKEIEEFKLNLQAKNEKWLNDISVYIDTVNAQLKSRLNSLEEHKTKPLKPGEEPRFIKQVHSMYKRLLDVFQQKMNSNYSLTRKFFLKTHRHRLDALKQYIEKKAYILNEDLLREYKDIPQAVSSINTQIDLYNSIKSLFFSLLNNIESINESYYTILVQKLREKVLLYGGFSVGPQGILVLDDEDRMAISNRYENLDKEIGQQKMKLKSLYSLNYNIMDLIIDSQFFVLYMIKGIRILFTYIALFLSTRVFSPIYESVVYDQKKPPPGLWKYMFIFLGFDIAFNTFLVVVLFLLQFLFKTPDNNFIIDKYIFYKYLTDYAIGIVTLFVVGILISKVVMEKKYFKYKYEGLRAIRAFESILFYTAIIIYMFPYFMIV